MDEIASYFVVGCEVLLQALLCNDLTAEKKGQPGHELEHKCILFATTQMHSSLYLWNVIFAMMRCPLHLMVGVKRNRFNWIGHGKAKHNKRRAKCLGSNVDQQGQHHKSTGTSYQCTTNSRIKLDQMKCALGGSGYSFTSVQPKLNNYQTRGTSWNKPHFSCGLLFWQ